MSKRIDCRRHCKRYGLRAIACMLTALTMFAAFAPHAAADPDARLEYAPDANGAIRTWLVSEPIKINSSHEFFSDQLTPFGGEAEFVPTGLVNEAGDNRLRWNVLASEGPVLPLARDTIRERSVFYMTTTIIPEEGGTYEISAEFWAYARIWVDGKLVLDETARQFGVAQPKARVELTAGQPHRILVKIGSERNFAHAGISIKKAGAAAKVACVLPVESSQRALASYLPASTDVTIHNYRFFEPDRTARMRLGLKPGHDLPVGLDTTLTATVRIRTREGKRLETIQLKPFKVGSLINGDVSFSYRPRQADVSAYYRVTVDFEHDGRRVGTAEKLFYCIEGIVELGNEVQRRAERFYRERSEEEIYADENLAYLLMKLEQLRLLYDNHVNSPTFGERAIDLIAEAERRVVDVMEKRLYLRPGPGLSEHAYISRIDDSAQPYFIYVPLSYNAMQGAPLVVYLHGYVPDLNKHNLDEQIPVGMMQMAEKHGYLMVVPFGRSNTDFQAIGEDDVMQVLHLAMRKFNVQRDRVFLVGYSMGGSGGYTIASHYPDVFAGVVSLAGRSDFYLWHGVKRQNVLPFKPWLIDLEFSMDWVENFRHVPVLAIQGEYDRVVEVDQSRRKIQALQALDYDATFFPVRGGDHWIGSQVFASEIIPEWMSQRRRPADIDHVTFATYTLKYNKAYWVTIDDFSKWGERALIDVKVTGENELTVEETNVAAFTLNPPRQVIDPAQPISVKVNDEVMQFDTQPIKIVLEQPEAAPLRKTPQLTGPYKEIFSSRFVFVYGTQGSPRQNKELYEQAERSVTEWRNFVKAVQLMQREADPLMVRDRDLTKEQRESSNLILIGTPSTNSVLAEIHRQLPIRIRDENTFVVGGKEYTGQRLGLRMIYPSPFSKGRYIAVMTGHFYGDGLFPNHKYDMLPDFIIYDDTFDTDIPGYFYGRPNRARCAGFFDKYWQLDENLMWTQDAAAERATTPAFR